MAVFAEEFRSLVQEFLLVLLSNYFQFFIQAQEAFQLVTKHFPRSHKLHKVLRPKCNRRKKAECPMKGNCQVNNVIYKFDVTRPLPEKVYLGLAEGEWKSRFYNHRLYTRDISTRPRFQVTCDT